MCADFLGPPETHAVMKDFHFHFHSSRWVFPSWFFGPLEFCRSQLLPVWRSQGTLAALSGTTPTVQLSKILPAHPFLPYPSCFILRFC